MSTSITTIISATVGSLTIIILLISSTAFITIIIVVVILRRKLKKSRNMVQQLAATASNQQTEMQENACYGQTEYECIIIILHCMHCMQLQHVYSFYECFLHLYSSVGLYEKIDESDYTEIDGQEADNVVVQQPEIPARSSTQLQQNVSYISSVDHGNDNTNEQVEYVHYGYKPVNE